MSDSGLQDSLATLSQFFVGERSFEDTLHRVSELTVEAIPAVKLAGITMLIEGRHRTAVFTDESAIEMDQAQYDAGEGPCMEAFAQRQTYTIDATSEDGRWPDFRRAAAEHGIGSTLSLPLLVDARAVGAMNLYATEERAFKPEDRHISAQFASQAAIVLANSQAYWDVRNLGEHLAQAMRSRAGIEQAKGILMAAEHCTEDEAFDMMVRASQRENTKLRDIASRIVAATQQPGPAAGLDGGDPPPA